MLQVNRSLTKPMPRHTVLVLFMLMMLLVACGGDDDSTDTDDTTDNATPTTVTDADAPPTASGRATLPPQVQATDTPTPDPDAPAATDRPTRTPFPTATDRPTFEPTTTPDPDAPLADAQTDPDTPNTFAPEQVELIFESARGGQFVLYGVPASGDPGGEGALQLPGTEGFNGFVTVGVDGRFAFVSTAFGGEDVFIGNLNGGIPTRLTFDAAIDVAPRFSPDGEQIAFISNRAGSFDLYVVIPGGEPVALEATFDPSNDFSPVWTPGGGTLLFTSDRGGGEMIYRYDLGTDTVTPLNVAGFVTDVSPDGTQVLLEVEQINGNFDVLIMNIDGSNLRGLVTGSEDERGGQFSPDGLRVAFYANRGGNTDVYIIPARGGDLLNVSNNPAQDRRPAWVR